MLQVPRWELALKGEVLGRDSLPALLPAWEDLCRRSAEDNAYYTPRYATALLDSVDHGTEVGFAVVWDGPRLVGMLPFTTAKIRAPMAQAAGRAWQTKFTFSCTPLLDAACYGQAADLLLDVLVSIRASEWILPTLNVEGEACEAMIAALARRGLPWLLVNPFQRAVLDANVAFEDHMKRHVAPKRRKELARNRRRLEEVGKVEHQSYRDGEGLERAVMAFLDIEARGWKGQRGTALACDERTRGFAMRAFAGDAAGSTCRADVLTLDGAPVAVGLTALAGHTGFTVKSTYDEAYRSYAAGLLLEVEVIRSVLSEKWATRLDSGTPGTHVIDGLWPGRLEVADLMFSLSPQMGELRLRTLQRSDAMVRTLKTWAKRGLQFGRH